MVPKYKKTVAARSTQTVERIGNGKGDKSKYAGEWKGWNVYFLADNSRFNVDQESPDYGGVPVVVIVNNGKANIHLIEQ